MHRINNILNPLPETEHLSFLEKLERYSFFQTPDWIRILTTSLPSYQNTTCLFEFSDKSKLLLPLIRVKKLKGLLSTYHSMPFHTYGGLLGEMDNSDEKVSLLMNYLKSKKWVTLSITPDPLNTSIPLIWKGIRSIPMETQILHLERGYEWIWENQFHGSVRTSIRKAKKEGLTVTEGLTNAAKVYGDLYRDSLKKRKGAKGLVYPQEIFHQLSQCKRNVKFYFALLNDQPIAGIIVLYGKKEASYWSGVILPEYKQLNATQLLLDFAIQKAIVQKIAYFDFGASRGLPTVKKFKSFFGTEDVGYTIYEW